ncbi:MAG: beta-Ala-His dipeptidase [Lentisphaeria bacterium]|nr:beta-Ala-His dipeptidase [Lentisphaeria bacterium]
MDLVSPEPAAVWRRFSQICAIPHPSGHEEKLARFLAAEAEDLGLAVRMDDAFNLRIDRKASPGREGSPRIIFQAHLDMVPQAAPGKVFDFSRDPVTPVVKDGFVRACGTTLGADDGIGVAMAMALLEEPELDGNFAALFTVSEETGLVGAAKLDPGFLDGDILINLDHSEEGKICIGCAGGARVHLAFDTGCAPVPAGRAVRIVLAGLPGGHSGVCIHEKRGNALVMLARLLRAAPCAVASFDGGTVDNAIPARAEAVAVLADPGAAEQTLRAAADVCRRELDPRFSLELEICGHPVPERVWDGAFQERFLAALATAPDGVADFAPEYGVPRTSGNIASLRTEKDILKLVFSTRSLDDAERRKHTDRLIGWFSALAPRVAVTSEYPGWKPAGNARLPGMAARLRRELTGKETVIEVIHAGLEAGLFAGKNPRLEMMSCGPAAFDIHTPDERLSIASVQEFYPFIRTLALRLMSLK